MPSADSFLFPILKKKMAAITLCEDEFKTRVEREIRVICWMVGIFRWRELGAALTEKISSPPPPLTFYCIELQPFRNTSFYDQTISLDINPL